MSNFNEKPLKIQVLSIEQALQLAGNGQTYQNRVLIYLFLQTIFCSFFMSNNQFFFPNVDFRCVSDNTTLKIDQKDYCNSNISLYFPNKTENSTIECSVIARNTSISHSVSQSFNLYCSDSKFANYNSYDLKFLAWIIGSFLIGYYQNTLGRLLTLKRSILLMAIFTFILMFSVNILMFTVIYFIMNICAIGYIISALIYIAEVYSENLRPIGFMLILMGLGFGPIILSFLCTFYCNWRFIAFIYTVLPIIFIYIYMRVMSDSPRFLNTMKKFRDSKMSLSNIALINDRISLLPKDNEFKFEEEVKCQEMQENFAKLLKIDNDVISTKPKKHNYWSLFNYNSVRVRSVIFLYFWCLFGLGSIIGFLLYHNFVYNLYLNGAILGLLKIIGFLIGGYLVLNFQRKIILKNILLIEGIVNVMFLLIFYQYTTDAMNHFQKTLFTILIIIAQACFDVGFSLLLIYTIEVYPTVIRHFAVGFFVGVTCLMMLLANIIAVHNIGLSLLIIIGGLCFAGLAIMNKLRETYELGIKENLIEEEDALLNNEIMN